MSKVAVCISGSQKHYKNCLETISKIKPNNFLKVFIHTWDLRSKESLDYYLSSAKNSVDKSQNRGENKSFLKEEKLLTDFSEFNPERVFIEKPENKNEEFLSILKKWKGQTLTSKEQSKGRLAMLYSMHKSGEEKKKYEKEHGMTFDHVIRIRFDTRIVKKELNLQDIYSYNSGKKTKEPLPPQELHIPSGHDYNGINIQFAIGTSKAMDTYFSLYKDILDYKNNTLVPEHLLAIHLKTKSVDSWRRLKLITRINNQ